MNMMRSSGTTMAIKSSPENAELHRKAKAKCQDDRKTRLQISRCIRNEFFKQCKKRQEDDYPNIGRVVCHSVVRDKITGVAQRKKSRLDQVKRQRGIHVTTYLLLDAVLRCGGAGDTKELRGASCLPSVGGHGRRSIDDYIDDPTWPPVLRTAAEEGEDRTRKRNKKCLFRLALLKDQLGPRIRMYWGTAKYHDFDKEETIELGKRFFTMSRESWIKTYLEPNKAGMGFRILDGLSDKEHQKKIKQLLAKP